MKESILYLCHRIPFPPTKGEKIAAFHLLKYLNQHYQVHLGFFIDDPQDKQYVDKLTPYCHSQFHHPLSKKFSYLLGLSALFTHSPITLPFYHRQAFQSSVDKMLHQHAIHKVVIFSSSMAQYIFDRHSHLHTLMNFVDMDSDKWQQYSQNKHGLSRYIYRREHRQLQRYETKIAIQANVSCFVTHAEACAFKRHVSRDIHNKIKVLENGIDHHFFNPIQNIPLHEPYPLEQDNYLVFTGVMDYWANVDAVSWFVRHVWQKVLRQQPNAKFYIVGSHPTAQVKRLSKVTGVIVTGKVHDVRPYLKHAKAVVAPMQIACGVQNKVLEAMAMQKPIYCTTKGMLGIEVAPCDTHDSDTFVCDDPRHATYWCLQQLSQPHKAASQSRNWVTRHYSWDSKLSIIKDYLDESRY